MAITPLPPAPNRSMPSDVFASTADVFLAALPQLSIEMDAAVLAMNNNSTNSTSTTSLSIATGSVTLTVQTGKSYVVGQTVKIAYTTDPTKWMLGDITSYVSGTGVMIVAVSVIQSTGTFATWTVSLAISNSGVGFTLTDLQTQAKTGFTSAGTSPAFTVSTSAAYGALSANQRLRVKFHAAGVTGSNTLNRDATGVKNIKQYDPAGVKVAAIVTANLLADVEYDGVDYVVLNQLPDIPAHTSQGNKILRSNGAISQWSDAITLATLVNSTSGTSIDFTSIPPTVRRATVMFHGVSTNGTTVVRVQLAAGGSVETTGYSSSGIVAVTGSVGVVNSTAGFDIADPSTQAATYTRHGMLVLCHMGNNIWCADGGICQSDGTRTFVITGSKALAGVLDRIRITTANGTDTFDAGNINISYE